jgi:DNA-binding transcriptional MocR family regulator
LTGTIFADMTAVSKKLLYVRVAETIGHLIEQHVWQPGEKIPSVRQLSREHRVSLSTCLQAYYYLERRGVIEARPQSGYYVRPQFRSAQLPVPKKSISATHSQKVDVIEPLTAILQAQAGQQLPFAVARPSLELLPTVRLNQAVRQVLRTNPAAGIGYEQTAGNELLRRQIAQQATRWGGVITAPEVIITNGCLEAVHLCLRAVTRPGDTVAVETPTYYGLLQVIENLGLKALEIATDPQTGVDLDELEKALQQPVAACLFVPSFNNPLGSCMPDEHKKRLVEMLTRLRIPLIEDDIYGDLYFGPVRPKACKAFDAEGWVLLCSSFSKQLAPGYRVGWVIPGRFAAQVEGLKHSINVMTSTLPQLAISEFIAHGRYDHHLRQLRAAFAAQVTRVSSAIQQHFPVGTRVTRPSGGFVLWIELPAGCDAAKLHALALTQGIGFMPGSLFSAQKRYTNCLRLTCGQPWNAEMERALKVLGHLFTAIEAETC